MKKKLLIVVSLCGVLALTGCGKASESDLEDVNKNDLVSGVIEIDFDSYELGDTKEFENGVLDDIAEDDELNSTTLRYKEVKLEDAKKYIEEVMSLGYKGGFLNEEDNKLDFLGFKDDSQITISFYDDNYLNISYIEEIPND